MPNRQAEATLKGLTSEHRPRARTLGGPRLNQDDALVSRAKQGEPAAWHLLYEAHAGRLLLWLQTRPNGDPVASPEDIAAEAWLVAANRIHRFTGDSDEFAGWLFGIARKLASNAARRTARRGLSEELTPDAADRAVDETAPIEQIEMVNHLLGVLPKRERQVVACIDVVGLDVAATAAALGMKPTAVRVAHHRGLNRLRATHGADLVARD